MCATVRADATRFAPITIESTFRASAMRKIPSVGRSNWFNHPCLLSRPLTRLPESPEFIQAGGTLPDMIEDGVESDSFRVRCQCSQSGLSWTTDTLGVGMLLLHSATECGDQIVKLFLAAHNKPLQ